MIPAVFINLDRDTRRRAWMEAWLSSTGTVVTRLAAIDGTQLSSDGLALLTKSFRGTGVFGPREVACYLSHREAWKHASRQTSRWTFIAEDDLHAAPDFSAYLQGDAWIPNDADLVKAETTFRKCHLGPAINNGNAHRSLHLLKSLHGGAGSYFIARDFAEKLVERTESSWDFADFVLFDPRFHAHGTRPRVYQIDPAPTLQDIFLPSQGRMEASSLVPERTMNKRSTLWQKLGRELIRPVRRLSSGLTERLRAKLLGTVYRRVSFKDGAASLLIRTGDRYQ